MDERIGSHSSEKTTFAASDDTPPQNIETGKRIERQLSPEEIWSLAQETGDLYIELVGTATGTESIDSFNRDLAQSSEQSRAMFSRFTQSITDHRKECELRLSLGNFDAQKLLEQTFDNSAKQILLDQKSNYRLEALSQGIPAVFMKAKLYHQLRGKGAQAQCIHFKNGISYLLIPEFDGEEYHKVNQQRLSENIPHETHHLLWKHLQRDGIISTSEADPQWGSAFQMFQDEIIAKASSGGPLLGYSHLNLVGNDIKQRIVAEDPQRANAIQQTIIELNEELQEIASVCQSREVSPKILIWFFINARNFTELRNQLAQAKVLIASQPEVVREQPQEPEGVPKGWGFF